jgi:hypothetical protein
MMSREIGKKEMPPMDDKMPIAIATGVFLAVLGVVVLLLWGLGH